MTTIDINELSAPPARSFRLLGWMGTSFSDWRRAARRRRVLQDLSALDAHLLRDIGLDWEDVHDGILGRRRAVWLNPLARERS